MLIYTERARRDLERLSQAEAERIANRLAALDAGSAGDVKKLKGREGYRLRVGSYRVLFDREGKDIVVQRIAHRRDVYR